MGIARRQLTKEGQINQNPCYDSPLFVELAGPLLVQAYKRVTVYLDGNATHRQAMGKAYTELSHGLAIEVDFVHFAPYSPWMNVVEYGIHWLRQRYLHQANSSQTLADVADRLTTALATPATDSRPRH